VVIILLKIIRNTHMKKSREIRDAVVLVILFSVVIYMIFTNPSVGRRCATIRQPTSLINQDGSTTYYYNLGKGKILETTEELAVNSIYCYPFNGDK